MSGGIKEVISIATETVALDVIEEVVGHVEGKCSV
jgi:hypothetical protein